MHHVAVALNVHQAIHLHAAELAYPAHIVPAQVYQHHVLGALLLVVHHLVLERQIFCLGGSAGPRSSNGPVLHLALVHAHQQLRRGTRQFDRTPACFLLVDCFGLRWRVQPAALPA